MSLYDKLKHKKKQGTRHMLKMADVGENCVVTPFGERLAFLVITPVNMAVLSNALVGERIDSLTNVLKTLEEADLLCVNSTQSFQSNKDYITKLMENETNDIVQMLDEKDILFLDEIRINMATSREFLVRLRFKRDVQYQLMDTDIKRTQQLFKEYGFECQIADREELKRTLAIYFAQNIYEDDIPDYDGQPYLEEQ